MFGRCLTFMQVQANNLMPVLPHISWTLPPAAPAHLLTLTQQQPLHHMWDLLTAALGYTTAIDPHLAVALLLSAAAVGGTCSHSGSSPGSRQGQQVSRSEGLSTHQHNSCLSSVQLRPLCLLTCHLTAPKADPRAVCAHTRCIVWYSASFL